MMMDYLARRKHSEKELRLKLEDQFEDKEIQKALEYGKAKGWIPASDEDQNQMAQETAEALKNKGKGIEYINQYLAEKGLPKVQAIDSEELEKARQLVENKFGPLKESSEEESEKQKAKMGRFLASRGFTEETVRKVIYED